MNPNTPTETPSVILVHGVGADRPGQMLDAWILRMIKVSDSASVATSALVEQKPPLRVREVFWADLKQAPPKTFLKFVAGVYAVGFVLRFMLALAQVASNGWQQSQAIASNPTYSAIALRSFLFGLAIPSPIFFMLPLHYALMPRPIAWVAMASTCIIALGISAYLSRYDLSSKCGLIVAVIGSLLVPIALHQYAPSVSELATMSATLVGLLQLSAAALVIISIMELLIRYCASLALGTGVGPVSQFPQLLLKMFALTFPFAVIGGGFGALNWATNLGAAQYVAGQLEAHECTASAPPGCQGFCCWSFHYQSSLRYDLALMEAVFASAMFLFGAILVCLIGAFFLRLWLTRHDEPKPALGDWFRHGLKWSLLM